MLRRLSLLECSLDADELSARAKRLSALEARALESGPHGLGFAPDPALAAEIAELASLETQCCKVRFRLEIEPDSLLLVVDPR